MFQFHSTPLQLPDLVGTGVENKGQVCLTLAVLGPQAGNSPCIHRLHPLSPQVDRCEVKFRIPTGLGMQEFDG